MRWILFVFTIPWTLITWLLGALSIACWMAHNPKFVEHGLLRLQWRSWWLSMWPFSTTLGRTQWLVPVVSERLLRHENIHTHQVEDLMMLSFLIGGIMTLVTGNWVLGLALWTSGGVWQLPNFLTAVLRHGIRNIYRDSEHERSAYAQTDRWPDGDNWWDYRERARAIQRGIT